MNDAERLAHRDYYQFDKAPNEKTKIDQIQESIPRLEHVISAAKEALPGLDATKLPQHGGSVEGYIYVLYDGQTKLCKIGCTKSEKRDRQRAIISAHGVVLVNILNARVKDRRAAEAQCHKRFAENRRNGEWFEVEPIEVIDYIRNEIKWSEIDFENASKMLQYITGTQSGDLDSAPTTLVR